MTVVSRPAETTVGRAALRGTDLDSVAGFYCSVVGPETIRDAGNSVVLLVPDGNALAAVRDRLREAGIDVSETADGIVVDDGDGIGVRFAVD